MGKYFLDSSALVKRFIREEGTARVLELVRGVPGLRVSRLALVEVTSTLVRRARGGDLEADVLDGLLRGLENEFRSRFDVQPLSEATFMRGADLVRSHALRAADAIQLASALECAAALSNRSDLTLVSSDHELNAAAEQEGLTVLDPQQT